MRFRIRIKYRDLSKSTIMWIIGIMVFLFSFILAALDIELNPSRQVTWAIGTILMSLPLMYFVIPGMKKWWLEGELNHQSIEDPSWFNWKWYLRNMKPVSVTTSQFYITIAIFIISLYLLFWWGTFFSDVYDTDMAHQKLGMVLAGPWVCLFQCSLDWMLILFLLRLVGLDPKPTVHFHTEAEGVSITPPQSE